ncbi:MAG: small conductance mechanosensitive channel [Glaciecola sp.]|jgi:small-conductance mechanosensitive channel
MDELLKLGSALIPFILTIIVVVLFLIASHKVLLGNKSLHQEAKLPRKLILLLLYIIGVIGIAIALPVGDSTRNQVISLIGILLSGVIAFSSTTIVANVMAGIVLRFTKPFRTGDFIRVDGFFGRVTEKGLFDTEIQTEQRDLIAFTNSFLISHPLQVVRSSGTIVSANLSLGYDLHHSRVEPLLIKAAELSELEGPFVQILELGDHAITYRISGLLTEVKSMISSRSKLYMNIMDCLHDDNIEIVSPGFMNQRKLPDDMVILPVKSRPKHKVAEDGKPEDLIFDKADEAEAKERTEIQLLEQLAQVELALKTAEGEAKNRKQNELAAIQEAVKQLQSAKSPSDKT